MSDNKSIYQKTIIRLYHNPNFGKAIGAKRKNQFIFNGSVEFPNQGEKLFVDLTDIDHMKDACIPQKYNYFLDIICEISKSAKADIFQSDRFFFGQLKIVHPERKFVDGFVLYDAQRADGTVCIFKDDGDIQVFEQLTITACFGEKKGRSPDYFGCNFDLEPKSSNANNNSPVIAKSLKDLGIIF
jgi:hypothetical protein